MSTGGHAPRPRSDRGPWLIFLPLVFLAAALFWYARGERSAYPFSPPRPSDPEERIPGLAGQLTGADGSRLEAQLAPLHADAERQSFERESLRRRLGLDPAGEPWRLTLRWVPPSAEGRGSGLAGGLEAPARDEPAGLHLGPVEVRDGTGAVLSSIDAGAPSDGGPLDPVRSLFSPPGGALRPGQAADWVLWGARPSPGSWLEGLWPAEDDPDAAEFQERTGLSGTLVFEARPLRRADLQLPLARLDRDPDGGPPRGSLGGKKGAAGTSDSAVETPDEDR